jgi:nitrogen regulatory protein PII
MHGRFFAKNKNEGVLADGQVSSAVEAIVKAAKTGKIGDGKVFVSSIENAVRIRTEEVGEQTVWFNFPSAVFWKGVFGFAET